MSKKDKTVNRTSLADFLGSGQWLITDAGRAQIESSIETLAMDRGESSQSEHVALAGVVNVVGPISRYENWVSEVLGWATTQGIQRSIMEMDSDPAVKTITMYFDTPGGVVHGLPECAKAIRDCQTPIVAFTSGYCASAGYWLASQCDAIFTGPLGVLGSIGVVSAFYKPEKEAVSSRNAPRKLGSREQLQDQVDVIEAYFFSDVAHGRGVTVQHVIENYGKGGVFIGQAAVDAGLADGVSSFDHVIVGEVDMPPVPSTTPTSANGETMNTDSNTGGISAADHEAAIKAAKESGIEEGKKLGKAEGEAEAVARVTAILKAGEGKDQEIVQAYIEDGVTAELATKWLAKLPDVASQGNDLNAQMHGTNPDITGGKPDGEQSDDDKDDSEVTAAIDAALGGK